MLEQLGQGWQCQGEERFIRSSEYGRQGTGLYKGIWQKYTAQKGHKQMAQINYTGQEYACSDTMLNTWKAKTI